MKTFLALLFVVSFAACASEKALQSLREDLHNTVIEYNDLLHKHEFVKAESFVYEPKRNEFEAGAKAAQGVKILRYDILRTDYEIGKGEEIFDVEFIYSISPSSQVNTLIDKQQWSFLYVEKEGRKSWRLISPFPEFK
jgi:hypothetical protein